MARSAWLFGEKRENVELSPALAAELVEQGRESARRLAAVSLASIIDVLERTGAAWEGAESPWRHEALEKLSAILPFSREMIEFCLDLIPGLLSRTSLEERLTAELGDLRCLDWWGPQRPTRGSSPRFDGLVRAYPLGLMVHVSAGNVFLGALDSIVMGLLTKNAAIVKLASADPVFPVLFAQSLAQADSDGVVASSLALVPWKGGDEGVENVLKRGADGVIVWGGEEAVTAYRTGLGPSTRLIEHGPKLSFAICLREALEHDGPGLARGLARDVALWDQAACASPQFAYVEGSREDARSFARLVAEELEGQARSLPPGTVDFHEQVELTKVREMARMAEALGEGAVLVPKGRAASWTVVVSSNPAPEASPLNRCIILKPVASAEDIPDHLRPVAGHLQSVGLAGSEERMGRLATAIGAIGACRFTSVGSMGKGVTGAPHDGRYGLEDLVRWAAFEGRDESTPREKLGSLLAYACERSPFFETRLSGLDLTLGREIHRVPLTTSDDVVAHVPPRGSDLLTGTVQGAHVFASGGSTGAPKYTFYTADEFGEVGRALARCFMSAGLSPEDRTANIFVAGNLWTSFLAVHQALEHIGCFSIPIGGTSDLKLTLKYVADFRATVLMGIPSVLLELARIARAEGAQKSLCVRLVLYAGEHMTDATSDTLSEVFGGATVRSAGYASVDAGTIGYQCSHVTGSWHHLLEHHQHLEILHPERHTPVAPGEVGEMVVTNLSRRLQPVIRMSTGDLGRLSTKPCTCRSHDRLFELLGRADDRVFVGGGRFLAGDVAKLCGSVEGLSAQIQIVVDTREGADYLTLCVEALVDTSEAERAVLAEHVLESLLADQEDLHNSVKRGWLAQPSVEIFAPGGLPRVRRTGKVKRVVDNRKRPA